MKKDLKSRSIQNKTNPYKAGDWVVLKIDVKDAYLETWHYQGDKVQVKSISKDGKGLMFSSDLGVHWKCVEEVK